MKHNLRWLDSCRELTDKEIESLNEMSKINFDKVLEHVCCANQDCKSCPLHDKCWY